MKARLALVGLQGIFVLALAAASARPIPFEFSRPMAAALVIWLVGLTFLGLRLCWTNARAGIPVSKAGPALRAESLTVSRAFTWAMVLGLAMALHGWAKSMIPHVSGYWADPILADLDELLFGVPPWQLVRHELLAPLYAQAYVSWFPITFGTMGVLAFSRGNHERILTLYLAILIIGGTVGQYVLPSGGPIFYERLGFGTRFNELVATNDPTYARFADYLWSNLTAASANLGTGISAMPSMHVSMAIWTIIAARAISPLLAIPAAAYALTIWLASIASGWHYATDGLIGAVVVFVCYRLVIRPEPQLETTPVAATAA